MFLLCGKVKRWNLYFVFVQLSETFFFTGITFFFTGYGEYDNVGWVLIWNIQNTMNIPTINTRVVGCKPFTFGFNVFIVWERWKVKFVFCVCTTKYEHPRKKHKSTKKVIYENVNYDLIRTNKFPISLLISNHIRNTLCFYIFFANIHLVTFENLLLPGIKFMFI